jgi:hypothetical protein
MQGVKVDWKEILKVHDRQQKALALDAPRYCNRIYYIVVSIYLSFTWMIDYAFPLNLRLLL